MGAQLDMAYCGADKGHDMSPGQIQDYAARSLNLLHAIEETVLALDTECSLLREFQRGAQRLLGKLRSVELDSVIDPEYRISGTFRRAAETAQRVYDSALSRRDAATEDAQLTADDGVVDAYDQYLVAVADYHDTLVEFREYIETHDALLSPLVGDAYTDVDSLLADIVSGK